MHVAEQIWSYALIVHFLRPLPSLARSNRLIASLLRSTKLRVWRNFTDNRSLVLGKITEKRVCLYIFHLVLKTGESTCTETPASNGSNVCYYKEYPKDTKLHSLPKAHSSCFRPCVQNQSLGRPVYWSWRTCIKIQYVEFALYYLNQCKGNERNFGGSSRTACWLAPRAFCICGALLPSFSSEVYRLW